MTRADVVAYLEGLDAVALADLIDELQRRLGLRPVASPPPFVTMGAPLLGEPEAETEFSVVITGYAEARRVALMQALRELRPLGVLEARRLVDSVPVVFAEGLDRRAARTIADRLREAGAQVDVR